MSTTAPTTPKPGVDAYMKSIAYIALAAMTFLVSAFSDGKITGDELINLAIVVLGAIGVYFVPNLPKGWWAERLKGILAFVIAGLIALVSFWTDGVTLAEWMQVGVAALAAIGVSIVPNAPLPAKAR